MKSLVAAVLVVCATAAAGAPLTVRTGETWLFAVKDGEPANPRRAAPSTRPAKGQIAVTVRALMGTTMFVTNNSGTGYTLRAELLRGGRREAARACTIPSTGKPILESWPQKADAVRLSHFRPSTAVGCP